MLRLKKYYGIAGGKNLYPIEGVGPTDWLPWYELALRIASDLDESLNFVDAPPPAKTAARWRGPDGLFLVRLVDSIQENRPKGEALNSMVFARVTQEVAGSRENVDRAT